MSNISAPTKLTEHHFHKFGDNGLVEQFLWHESQNNYIFLLVFKLFKSDSLRMHFAQKALFGFMT